MCVCVREREKERKREREKTIMIDKHKIERISPRDFCKKHCKKLKAGPDAYLT